jgi:hypothetical protein
MVSWRRAEAFFFGRESEPEGRGGAATGAADVLRKMSSTFGARQSRGARRLRGHCCFLSNDRISMRTHPPRLSEPSREERRGSMSPQKRERTRSILFFRERARRTPSTGDVFDVFVETSVERERALVHRSPPPPSLPHLILPNGSKQIGRGRVRGELDRDHGLAVRLLFRGF